MHPPGKFRRRVKAGLLLLLALPLILFFLSNVWLLLPWGRNWVAAKISSRLGVQATIASASWSPWNGVCLNGLVVDQPEALRTRIHEPLFSASSIRIWPIWQAWLRRRLEIDSIEIESPRAVVPLELIAHLAGPARVVDTPPAVAVASPPAAPTPMAAADLPTAVPIPAAPGPVAEPPPAPPTGHGTPQPTRWIHLHQASLSIVTTSRSRPLFEALAFNADIPAAGDPADASATLGQVLLLDHEIAKDLRIPLHWQAPLIQLGPVLGTTEGLPYQLRAQLACCGNLPLSVELDLPTKSEAHLSFPNGKSASAREFRATGRFGGLLTAPSTWQGNLLIIGRGLALDLPPRPPIKFDQGAALFVLRGGVLSCRDGRLIGDELSLLGNASMLADGRTAAVLRIVAGHDTAQGIANEVGRATGKRMAFSTLGTPDRLAADLYALGNLDGIQFQLGQGGDVIEATALLTLVKALATASQ